MSDLEKFKLMEKVKLAVLRHRGDALSVAKELDLDLAFVNKCIHKLRKKDERDVSSMISSTLMQHLFLGYQSRVHYTMEMLKSLDGRHQLRVSACCQHAVGDRDGGVVCLRCSKPCTVVVLDQHGVYDLKQRLLEQLRDEDKTLVTFAESMGYTNKTETPAVKFEDKRQYVVLGDSKVANDLARLDPIDREHLRIRLEKSVLDEETKAGG